MLVPCKPKFVHKTPDFQGFGSRAAKRRNTLAQGASPGFAGPHPAFGRGRVRVPQPTALRRGLRYVAPSELTFAAIEDWVQVGVASSDRKGGKRETNPMDLTYFLSVTYSTIRRNKPKRDMSHGISDLERKTAGFWRNLNDIEPGIH